MLYITRFMTIRTISKNKRGKYAHIFGCLNILIDDIPVAYVDC